MNYILRPYDSALVEILDEGVWKSNKRTGVRTKYVSMLTRKYRLDSDRFPIVTKRKMYPKAVFAELLWIISGSTNNNDLKNLGATFWSKWTDKEFEEKNGFVEGSLGKIYGFQLRHFGGNYKNGEGSQYGENGFDQLNYVIDRIKEDYSCRRIMWSLWNPHDLSQMKLPPCHWAYQITIDDEGRLTGNLIQRSADFPIGVPANIQFYSALTIMIAQQTGYKPYRLNHVCIDAHIYEDQIDQVKQYLRLPEIDSPKLEIKKAKDIFSYTMDDFILTELNFGPKLEIPVAV